ncbi:hypothetical protein P3602_21515 [Vibrio parahaemolyticus]|nr:MULTISPECIES: hypothetical protein [Vibrio]MDF5108489.1 hypothetical protein [Vibrio parahaemolyticus]MCA2420846.1 hypothetical protein [Vibrio alginolyticus]MCA2445620.1 hypothetical protein [Vibrio alginolyticus]MDF5143394.1 hypothetical protein [Vibrio parahaemolyticus]MDF5153820.1 hypothetical protein [Vibrio parahaemolyticus]
MNNYKLLMELSGKVTDRAKLLLVHARKLQVVGILLLGIGIYGFDLYAIFIGASIWYFQHITKSAGDHFHASSANVTMKVYKNPENYPPLNVWLVPHEGREITPDHYDELEKLVLEVNEDFITKKVQQVYDYRGGKVTYYDLANIIFLTEGMVRYKAIRQAEGSF